VVCWLVSQSPGLRGSCGSHHRDFNQLYLLCSWDLGFAFIFAVVCTYGLCASEMGEICSGASLLLFVVFFWFGGTIVWLIDFSSSPICLYFVLAPANFETVPELLVVHQPV